MWVRVSGLGLSEIYIEMIRGGPNYLYVYLVSSPSMGHEVLDTYSWLSMLFNKDLCFRTYFLQPVPEFGIHCLCRFVSLASYKSVLINSRSKSLVGSNTSVAEN